MKYLDKIKVWLLDRYYGGTPWDMFLLGLCGLVILVLASMVIGYAR